MQSLSAILLYLYFSAYMDKYLQVLASEFSLENKEVLL